MIAKLLLTLVLAAEPTAAPSEGPEVVYVGTYIHHIPEIDLKANTYQADFYMWFRWKGPIDPTKSFEFMNVADLSALVKTPIYVDDQGNSQPEQLDDGSLYQQFHIQGRFTHPFSVQNYPFDEQDVVFELEDTKALASQLVYQVDTVGKSGLHPGLSLAGWQIASVENTVSDSRYDTNFGDPRVLANAEAYTHLTARLHVVRPIWSSIVKSILPLFIVLLITMAVFLIDGKYFDARLGLGITTLISAVALQLTAGAELPNVGYVVLLDKLYNLSYAVIFIALLESVLAVRLTDLEQTARAAKYDRWSLAVCLTASLGVGLWLIVGR